MCESSLPESPLSHTLSSLEFRGYGLMRKRTRVVPQCRLHCYGFVPAGHSVDSSQTARCRSVQFHKVWVHASTTP